MSAGTRQTGVGLGIFVAGLFLAAALSFMVARFVQLQSDVNQWKQIHKGVCSYRHYLREQAADTRAYVKKNPAGIPSLHVTGPQLLAQAKRQADAADTLRGLDCHVAR